MKASMYEQLKEGLKCYNTCANTDEVMAFFKEMRGTINLYNSSLPETDDDEELDAGQAAELLALNTKMYHDKLGETMHPSHPSMQKKSIAEVLAPSHNTVKVETIEATTTNTESTMNIESMSLSELAALQVRIAARMQELLNSQQSPEVAAEPASVEVVIEETKQMVERHEAEKVEVKKAARVKKTTKKVSEAPVPNSPEGVVVPLQADKPAAPTYKEMQKYISAATKSNPAAKAIAQKVAKERGQKSWSTTGAAGYTEIYNQLVAL